MNKDKKRWQYRFDNYKRAYVLLSEAIDSDQKEHLSQLGKEGVIRRFGYCTELAWKTIKDYLESQGVVFAQITPRTVLKGAIASKLITHGQDWMEALDTRNAMSHTYDFKRFEQALEAIRQKYLNCFSGLYETLAAKYTEEK